VPGLRCLQHRRDQARVEAEPDGRRDGQQFAGRARLAGAGRVLVQVRELAADRLPDAGRHRHLVDGRRPAAEHPRHLGDEQRVALAAALHRGEHARVGTGQHRRDLVRGQPPEREHVPADSSPVIMSFWLVSSRASASR
jgi:hypothetical protein